MHIYTVHRGHKDHKCKSCGKSFVQAGDLKRHNHTIHEGHKDYKCKPSGKSFAQKSALKKYIHTVHKDHKCKFCNKSFSQAKSTSTQFIKPLKITNANLVVNHFLKLEL